MTLEEFKQSLSSEMPSMLSLPLQALWLDAQEDWEGAHDLLQEDHTTEGAWVHAYLHRKEGDLSNAAYWYSRARKTPAQGDLGQEWEAIVSELLSESH